MNVADVIQTTKAYYCLECGVCTGSCPISRLTDQFSPRLMVERALLDPPSKGVVDSEVWTCLTCGACSARCPAQVEYNEFSRLSRVAARERGDKGIFTHAGILQAMAEIQTLPTIEKNISHVTKGLKISQRGEFLFFAGCQTYYNVIFEDIGVDTLTAARSAISILNTLDIKPIVSPQERCCGHDAYWTGDEKTFLQLARHNIKMIKDSGAKKVIFSCPEGYATFKQIYPKYFGKMKFEVVHILELIADKIGNNGMKLHEISKKVTFQDPCRLGRFLGHYEAPRKIISSIPGIEFNEMPNSGPDALCCGSSAWVNCSTINKKIQTQRLQEAVDVGAEMLVTACPKCQIHLKCALHDINNNYHLEITDIHTLLAKALGG